MTSGVKWNEDYVDPRSDVNSFSGMTDGSRGSRLVFATGIFGQHIQFFPSEKLIVVSMSAWPEWTDSGRWGAREAYLQAVRSQIANAAR